MDSVQQPMPMTRYEKNIVSVLKQVGYIHCEKITDTLQGSIWRAIKKSSKKDVVIKVTSKKLHANSMIVVNDKEYVVDENILTERQILKYLTSSRKNNKKRSIVKYSGFFRSNSNYYLVMEDGGKSLFDFITRAHKLLQADKISIDEWIKLIKNIFKQLVDCVDYMHSKNICHFDISLENILINDVQIEVEDADTLNEKITFLADDVSVKLCDFGLAQMFTSQNGEDVSFESEKYCGKDTYKSPEVLDQIGSFNAKSNDIWCLGVCLFMMITGGAPWHHASEDDDAFNCMMNGEIKYILNHWNRLHYFTPDLLDLISSIFQYEDQRICLEEIKQHNWLKD